MQFGTGLNGYATLAEPGLGTAGLGRGGVYSPDPQAGTATQQAFGTIAGGSGASDPARERRVGLGVRALGTLSLVGLVVIYCSLPK
jgi:hypothetical protein